MDCDMKLKTSEHLWNYDPKKLLGKPFTLSWYKEKSSGRHLKSVFNLKHPTNDIIYTKHD